MGASLPAIAVDQAIPSQQVYRYRRQASSHSGWHFKLSNKKGDLSKVAFCHCAYCLLSPGGTPCTSVSSHGPFGLMERLQPLLQR